MTEAGRPLPLAMGTVVGAALGHDDAFNGPATRSTWLPCAAEHLVLLLEAALFTRGPQIVL